jgi:hypothetical protein
VSPRERLLVALGLGLAVLAVIAAAMSSGGH